ncbi:EscU/YscU/HrcU family type III secretion system export apparatus switch protein [Treponema bryantii]|uniref:EscU/YscU/HrcU family type III secretion system export apparatus switch protein n=1 Tax=Treponema bryantii TaxID=163 RepID=UPI0003B3776D|nr:EscU/YscU/HrcU family type III secretion system export apparatus switch protein [Treponema bryantii]
MVDLADNMDKEIWNTFAVYNFSNKISFKKLQDGIKSSDFLVSDDSCIHRLVGLRYDSKTMHEPEITIVCSRHEMAVAKQIAFSLGKRIYQKSALSAMLFHNYTSGQRIRCQDYNEVAKVYAKFICSKKKI